jgi:hypothetical protein
VVVLVERLRLGALFDAEVAGHPQVHQQRLARGQVGEQVLGAAVELEHSASRQPRGEVVREGAAQVGPAEHDLGDAFSHQHRCQPAADGLDFWQLGHGD